MLGAGTCTVRLRPEALSSHHPLTVEQQGVLLLRRGWPRLPGEVWHGRGLTGSQQTPQQALATAVMYFVSIYGAPLMCQALGIPREIQQLGGAQSGWGTNMSTIK